MQSQTLPYDGEMRSLFPAGPATCAVETVGTVPSQSWKLSGWRCAFGRPQHQLCGSGLSCSRFSCLLSYLSPSGWGQDAAGVCAEIILPHEETGPLLTAPSEIRDSFRCAPKSEQHASSATLEMLCMSAFSGVTSTWSDSTKPPGELSFRSGI